MNETDIQYFKRVVYKNTNYSDEKIQALIDAANKHFQIRFTSEPTKFKE